ncbi:MAG TPA: formate dehydrogenase accessory sulfurtransferase FdhD [Sandaracinaceae bacterium LLY-WYZ-13_1]|nr:formate dehydrogenase accessory sulfurtransferase FdhD [Sandaracinaceae bacterium LLY-WYZ-13_1]
MTERPVRRSEGDGWRELDDRVAVEAPLEVRLAGDPLMVTMRTPGEDRFLAVGFLFAEGVLAGLADVGRVHHCGRPGDEGWGNVIDVIPGPGVVLDASRLEGTRRGTLSTASCGVCGRRSIDDLLARIGELRRDERVPRRVVLDSPARLEEAQHRFAHTGGVHAAAAQTADGRVLAHAEDVGRHNAVDKVCGHLLYEGRLDEAVVLAVSGRVSFEIVQKAAAARVPVVTAVSAPTSLAVDLADRAGITLAAFVRGGRVNVYTHAHRIA